MKETYQDIIHLPRPVSQRHAPMTLQDRAAQFAPFAALTGYDDVIAESGRLTQGWIDLDEEEKARLDETLNQLRRLLPTQPQVKLVTFQADGRKAGGAYRVITGNVKKLDDYAKALILTDGTVIPVDRIFGIELEA